MRILVVDDDPSVRRLLSVQLGLAGHEVDIAVDGPTALLAVGAHPPDVLVLDVMMPHVDGWDVLKALRAMPQFAALPVVLLTARSQPGDVSHSYKLGASAVMSKPYDGDRLISMVEALHSQAGGRVASIVLVAERDTTDRAQVDKQLQGALASRKLVEHAKGRIAHAGALDIEDASAALRNYAEDRSLRVSEVAAAVVAQEIPALGVSGSVASTARPSTTQGR